MKQKNRIFLIPETVYDKRTEAAASLYNYSRCFFETINRLVSGQITKQEFVHTLVACIELKDKADEAFLSFGFPLDYFAGKCGDKLELMKAKEVFVNEILNMGEEPPVDDDEQECDDDDYFDYDDEDADADGGLTYMEVERMCDRLYELKEDAANSVVQSADLLKTTDELLEALEEIKYRLDR